MASGGGPQKREPPAASPSPSQSRSCDTRSSRSNHTMSSAMASSPSKIPLPKSRIPVVAAASSADDLVAAPPQQHHVSRIPKAVTSSPEKLKAAMSNGGDNGWKRSKSGGNIVLDGSATFVRRPSPPRVLAADVVVQQQQQQRLPQVDIDEEQFQEKVRQSRGDWRDKTSPSKSVASSGGSRRLSTSSTGSTGSNGASRIPVAGGTRSPTRQASPPRKNSGGGSIPRLVSADVPPKDAVAAMHLELQSTNGLNGGGSRIPLPRSNGGSPASVAPPPSQTRMKMPNASPSKLPTIGFSLSPERMKNSPAYYSETSSPSKMPSYSTSNLPTAAVAGEKKRQKQFEAFVMTGDRMIQLAKTPANMEFKSKYGGKAVSESNIVPLPPPPIASLAEEETFDVLVGESANAAEEQEEAVRMRVQPVAKRSLVRTSKSEDQLIAAAAEIDAALGHDDFDDVAAGSVSTLVADTSGVSPLDLSSDCQQQQQRTPNRSLPKLPTAASASSGRGGRRPSHTSSPTKRPSPEEISSMTSSYMSCSSEHYNAVESVLENGISPNSSGSPDTPEWSLMESLQHQKRTNGNASMEPLLDESITSRGNKVIISIGDTGTGTPGGRKTSPPNSKLSPVSIGSSSSGGSVTPEAPAAQVNGFHVAAAAAPGSISSEEDSDMESLHSYHPPAKVIDVPSAVRLAKRLFHLDGFKKTDVSRHLSKNTDYNRVVAEEYLKYFDFTGRGLDSALRQFLNQFCLTGETQERERVLYHFSRRFLACNPGTEGVIFASQDAVHTLTCAIMLLNTDLHGQNVQRKMTCPEFVDNLSGLNDNGDFPGTLLRTLYASIKLEAIPWSDSFGEDIVLEQQQQQAQPSFLGDAGERDAEAAAAAQHSAAAPSSSIKIGSAGGGLNPFLALPEHPDRLVDYKNGYVMRKSCFDAQGKKTKLGKRSWKMFFLTLREMVLYCFKDEKSVRSRDAFSDPSCAIRIHHGLAVRATDYSKKQFVFRLFTADQAQYLFQTSDEKELLTWINAINYVVASFASPQLPAACAGGSSSQTLRFQRPLLPCSKTKLGPQEQLEAHEKRLMELRDEIEQHLREEPAGRQQSGKQAVAMLNAYREKTDFLKFEIMRYETYVITLKTRSGPD